VGVAGRREKGRHSGHPPDDRASISRHWADPIREKTDRTSFPSPSAGADTGSFQALRDLVHESVAEKTRARSLLTRTHSQKKAPRRERSSSARLIRET
jgi:hypothetical protein